MQRQRVAVEFTSKDYTRMLIDQSDFEHEHETRQILYKSHPFGFCFWLKLEIGKMFQRH